MSKAETGEPTPRDPKALLSAGGLLASVAVVLVLGAVLHGRVPAPQADPGDIPAPALAVDQIHEEPVALPDSLGARAGRDRARLSGQEQRWTLQLVVACKEDGVRRLLDEGAGDERLFVLPRDVEGRACWAVTWGTFASEAEAAAATPPSGLRLTEPPRPRSFTAYLS